MNPNVNLSLRLMAVHGAGLRCVRHRCVAAAPLPIPLPFPQLFAPTVLRHGDVLCGASGHDLGSTSPQGQGQGLGQRAGHPQQSGAREEVEAVPVLSRMYATAAAADYARRQLQVFPGERCAALLQLPAEGPCFHAKHAACKLASGAGLQRAVLPSSACALHAANVSRAALLLCRLLKEVCGWGQARQRPRRGVRCSPAGAMGRKSLRR